MFLCGETKKVNALHFQTETVRVLIMCVTGVCSKEICKKKKREVLRLIPKTSKRDANPVFREVDDKLLKFVYSV